MEQETKLSNPVLAAEPFVAPGDAQASSTVTVKRDLEAAKELTSEGEDGHATSVPSEFLVSWDGVDDPGNPKNWSAKKRWTATFLVSSFETIYPFAATMIAPCISSVASDLKISSYFSAELCNSVFLIGIGFGPLFLAPLSEIYGRVPILLCGTFVFLVWNTASGFSQNAGQLVVFRLLSGFGASASMAVGSGVISDLWSPEKRGGAVALYLLCPLLGPALGPIAGGFVADYTSWRWVFWSVSLFGLLFQLVSGFFLRETFAPRIIQRRAARLRKQTGESEWHTEFDKRDTTLLEHLSSNLVRPLRLLTTQFIVQVLALYSAYLYGIMFLMLFTFSRLWTEEYHQSISMSGLNYISVGIGYVVGSQVAGPLNDYFYSTLKRRNDNSHQPEFRVALMLPGAVVTPLGLFLYGWTGHNHLHWILPNIGGAIFTGGIMLCFQGITTYTIDAYTRYAASAMSTMIATRSLAGFGMPLFGPYMFQALGYGWGNSVLGFVSIGLGWAIPAILWRYGPALRKRSTYAAGE